MANSKISALTSATTPLAGTEVLPVVQSSTTKQVSVANLTAGRDVSVNTLTSTVATGTAPFTVSSTTQVANLNAAAAGTASNLKSNATTGVMQIVGPAAAATRVMTIPDANFTAARTDAAQSFTGLQTFNSNILSSVLYTSAQAASAATYGGNLYIYSSVGLGAAAGGIEWQYATAGSGYGFKINVNGGTDSLDIGYRANSATFTKTFGFGNDGNLTPAIAAKGINFTANTAAAGKTSQLLNWYEEGTWTPNQGGGLTVVGAFSSQGKYTRVGRQVTIIGSVSGATSIAVNANSQISTNLPFATGVFALGSAMNNAGTAFSTTYVATSTIYSASAIGATTTISFQCTYFV